MRTLALGVACGLLSGHALAWQPCVPICDMFCAGLTMSIKSAEHTVKIGTGLAVETLKLRMASEGLKGKYKGYGDSLIDEWERSSQEIVETISSSTVMQLSTTDLISDSIGNISMVTDGSIKTRNKVIQGQITDLSNSITSNARSMTNAILLANEPEYLSDLSAKDILPSMKERQRLDALKEFDLKKQQTFSQMQKRIRTAINGRSTKLEYLSKSARKNVADQLLNLAPPMSDAMLDPLLAKSASIPLRKSLSRSFLLDFYAPPSDSLLQNNFKSETDLYGKLLMEINRRNQNLVQEFDIKFEQPFKDL